MLAEDSALESIAPVVADSGEGRWTAIESIELGVPTPVITAALMQRFASQGRGDYSDRLLARLRQVVRRPRRHAQQLRRLTRATPHPSGDRDRRVAADRRRRAGTGRRHRRARDHGRGDEGRGRCSPAAGAVSSRTQHQVRIDGEVVRYTATAGWLIMKNDEGKPIARFGYTAYTRDGVEDLRAAR